MAHFILSDDLTGAAGVASMVGASRAVTVNLERYDSRLASEFPCVVLNLDVRERSEREARRKAAKALRLAGESWVALRIDSALRGAVKGLIREIASRGRVLVTDTIPEYGRRTENGKTILGESVKDLREKLKQIQLERGADWVVVADSRTREDLVKLARRCETEGRTPVDPGPLVSLVVAGRLDASGAARASPGAGGSAGKVAFIIGTTDEMTRKQLRYMEREGHPPSRPLPTEASEVRIFSFSLERERSLIDAPFLESLRGYDSLVLSGGATASFVLKRSGFESIVSGREVQPLLSTGTVRGGLFDGKRVVLKGGFIGDEKTYKTILRWLGRT